jgi:hypothetical protein
MEEEWSIVIGEWVPRISCPSRITIHDSLSEEHVKAVGNPYIIV